MSRHSKWLNISVLILFVTSLVPAATGLASPQQNANVASIGDSLAGGIFVAIRASAQGAFEALGLSPRLTVDYGSYVWMELNANDFNALSRSAITFDAWPEGGSLDINGYHFDPLAGEPDVPKHMRSAGDGPGFHLIQFVGPTKDEWIAQMAALNLPALQYYPNFSYLTWGSDAQLRAAAGLPFVRWQGAMHPAYKISPDLASRTGLIQNVDIMFYNDGDVDATVNALQSLGASVLNVYPAQPDQAFFDAIVELEAAQLEAVAQLNTVLWLGYQGPRPVLDDEMSSQIVAGNHPGGVPVTGYFAHLANLGYDGSGVTWAIIDTGVDYDHPDLGSHIVGGYTFPGACNTNPGEDCAGGGHGTHVAGIVGGDATGAFTDPSGFLYGLGIAPGYGIFAMNSLSGSSWPPAGGWQEHSKRAVLGGAIGGNNSWTTGEGTQHGYQASERTHDIMVLDGNFDTASVAEPFIEVFSAGNSGTSGLTAPKEAKNLIVTASSRNYRVGSIDTISSFSSRGPAVDGRWVPTIAAPGEQIASSRNDLGGLCSTAIPGTNNLYAFCSGTSMAAPHTSGAITLATEWWRSFNSGADPSPAMAKALLVNAAVDMGAADIPNINEGWGRINVTNIISATAPTLYYDQPVIFGNSGEQWSIQVGVVDPTQPLKVTLAWADAPGAVGANPALVNNLDLTVVNGANTYRGNNFSSGWSTTGGSADTINNLENVYIQSPAGDATITIDATNIAGDAVLYNGDPTDQGFALVCSNCALGRDFTLNATPGNQAVCAPSDARYTVEVGSLIGFGDPVTLDASGHPAGTTASFSVNPVTPAAPPNTSTLTIANTGAATPGSYSIAIVGIAPTSTHTTTVGLDLFDAMPAAPGLLSPPDGAMGVSATPTFTWTAATQAASYLLEVASDAAFASVVYSATVGTTSHTLASPLNTNTQYFWRVTAANACGSGTPSTTFSFITLAAPGDCSIGQVPNLLFSDDFESGAPGWSSGGPGNTWTLSGANPHSGSFAYHADDISSLSEQYLQSPAITLPSGQSPLSLQFWNYQALEDSSAGGCFDGGLLDISTDGGATWTQVTAGLLTDPYDGPISTGFSNPRGGDDAWCGDPQRYLNSVVDLDPFAGQTVTLRFVLATDSSVSHPGWDLDDVKVQSCISGGSLSGTVANANSGLPIAGALLVADDGATQHNTTTNPAGAYTFPALPSGTYTVSASASGYLTATVGGLTVTPGATLTLDFDLDAPALAVDPAAFDLTIGLGYSVTRPLTLTNRGAVDNPFALQELDGGFMTTTVALADPNAVPQRLGPTTPTAFSAPSRPLVDVVLDGGFEAGTPNPFWVEASTNFGTPICDVGSCGTGTGTGPHSGSFWAWFGGISAYEESSVSQVITMPTGTAALTFWLEQIVCDSPADYLEVTLDGTQVFFSDGSSPLCGTLGYTLQSVDVSAFADGGPHTLTFHSEIFATNGGVSNFFVDDVVLDVTPDVIWLSENPLTGTVGAAASSLVDLTFDASVITSTGKYLATLVVHNADPEQPALAIPITMTVVTPAFGVQLSPPMALSGHPGDTLTYTLTLTNSGNVADTFDLALSGHSWPASLSLGSLSLGAGEVGSFTVTVSIPAGAADNASDTLTVTATSQTDPAASDTTTLTSTSRWRATFLPSVTRNSAP